MTRVTQPTRKIALWDGLEKPGCSADAVCSVWIEDIPQSTRDSFKQGMAYPGYGAPPPGGYGGVSEEGVDCPFGILKNFQ